MSDVERCELSELPVQWCACPRHRGGQAHHEAMRTGTPFEAAYAGTCERCGSSIAPGERIAKVLDDPGYVHAGACPRA